MNELHSNEPDEGVNAALEKYRQADIIDLRRQTHLDSSGDGNSTAARVIVETEASVVLTQTCDIVRRAERRPYVQVSPLVRISDSSQAAACREGAEPRFAWVPGGGLDRFADLEQIQTITKHLLVKHEPRRGVLDDSQTKEFGRSIGRKFDRYAFPDDVGPSLKKLRDRIVKKWDKSTSAEGRAWMKVQQVRATADSWDAQQLSVELTFIVESGVLPALEEPPMPSEEVRRAALLHSAPHEIAEQLEEATEPSIQSWLWNRLADAWIAVCEPTGSVVEITGEVISADEYTLDRYWASSALDIDYLSGPKEA